MRPRDFLKVLAWRLIKINPAVERLLETLDLLPKADKLPVRGVERPRKAIV